MTSKQYIELYEQKLKPLTEYHLNQLKDTLFPSAHLNNPPYDIYNTSAFGIYSEMIIRYSVNTDELIKVYNDLFELSFRTLMNPYIEKLGFWSVKLRRENIAIANYKATLSYDFHPLYLRFASKDTIFSIETSLNLLLYDPVEVKYTTPTFNLYYTEDHDKDLKSFYQDTKVLPTAVYVVHNKKDILDYVKHTPLYDLIERGDFQVLRTTVGLNKDYFLLVIPNAIYTWYGKKYTWAQTIHIVER